MKPGTLIDYKIRLLGIPIHWTSRITIYEPPHCFVDEQMRGPYRYWKHTHHFSEIAEGTLIEDQVDYAVPLGPLGIWLRKLFVERNLEKIFKYRNQEIQKIFVS